MQKKFFASVPVKIGKIGVYPKGYSDEVLVVDHKDYAIGESIPAGIKEGYWTLKDYMSQFKYVFTKKGATSLGGFHHHRQYLSLYLGLADFLEYHRFSLDHVGLHEPPAHTGTGWRTCSFYFIRDDYRPQTQ